jgi:putative ferrous iron transport protein C
MILQEIKQYVQKRKQVSLQDIAVHFDKEPETVRGILDFWVRKGRIKLQTQAPSCSGSCHCSANQTQEIYQWNAQLGNISIHIPQ